MTTYVHLTASQHCGAGTRPDSFQGSRARRLEKDIRASSCPRGHQLTSAAYENAVFIQAAAARFKGISCLFALLVFVGVLGFAVLLFDSTSDVMRSFRRRDWFYVFIGALFCVVASVATVAALSAGVRGFRVGLFGPKDLPIVFNRKSRKVYRFIQDLPVFPSSNNWREFATSLKLFPGYWLSAFKPWPNMLLIEYDWDSLEAEYFEQTTLMGTVVKTMHVLQLVAKESPTSNTVIGGFTLASPLLTGREIAMDLWEYIRRYMEENGPVIQPGDEPAPPHPKTLLQSANLVTAGPGWWVAIPLFAWGAWEHWKHDWFPPGNMGLVTFMVTFVCGLLLLLIVFNWLAHKFGRDVTLPPELLAEAGEPLDLQVLADQANARTKAGTEVRRKRRAAPKK